MNNGQPRDPEAVNHAALQDAALVRRFVNCRDEPAFAELVRRYGGLVYGVCRRVLHHRQDVEDAFQAAFLVLARDAPEIRNRASLASWLYGVAHRISVRLRAKKHRRRETPLQDDAMPDPNPFAELATRSELQVLDEELNSLPEKVREPLVLHYLLGRTSRQIADELQLSVAAVEGRLKRGRERLRERLSRRGVGLPAVLPAVQLFQSNVEASLRPSLLNETIQAGLGHNSAGRSHVPCSNEAAKLAAKEISTMTTTSAGTITVIALTATVVVGLAVGLSGPGNPVNAAGEMAVTNTEPSSLPATTRKTPATSIRVARTNLDDTRKPRDAAEKKSAVNRNTPPPTLDYKRRSKAAERIAMELDNPTQFDFVDTPLKDAVSFMSDLHGIPILIDETALKDAGVATDTPINRVLKGVRLRSGLRIILEPLGLDYVIRNEVMTVTSQQVAEEYVETHVYEVRHLEQIPTDTLVDVIQQTIRPGTWRSSAAKPNGGKAPPRSANKSGAVMALPGSIVVTHTQRAHEEIRDLLEQLSRHAPLSNFQKRRGTPQSTSRR